MMRFKVGDRVIYTGNGSIVRPDLIGQRGKIIEISRHSITTRHFARVYWDKKSDSNAYLDNLEHDGYDLERLVGTEAFNLLKKLNNETR